MKPIIKLIAAASISRPGLFFINLILLIVTLFLVYDISAMIFGRNGTIEEIDDLTDNVATIMVAFGVLIEERHEILKLIGSGKKNQTPDNFSDITTRYGVYFIVVGLFIEVSVEAMKIPIRFSKGGLLEEVLIAGSVLLSLGGLLASILFARDLLFRIKPKPADISLYGMENK